MNGNHVDRGFCRLQLVGFATPVRYRMANVVMKAHKTASESRGRVVDAPSRGFISIDPPPFVTDPETPTPPPASIKVAQLFYRKTGTLLLRPHLPRISPHDPDIWSLLPPALVALVLEPVQASVDAIVAGQLGAAQLGAVGFGTVLFQFCLGFFATFIFATTPLVASAFCEGELCRDHREPSRLAARGVWVAFTAGIVLQGLVWVATPWALGSLCADSNVASLTSGYLRARSWGIPAALVMMVGIGAGRGCRDMMAPCLGAASYLGALTLFDVMLVYGAHLGTEGIGYAAALAQWIGAVTILGVLHRRKEFDFNDLKNVPAPSSALPYIKMAPSLAVNNVAALGPILAATSVVTGLGPDILAAHTLLRQISGFWLQGFVAFNATAHSIIASSLGDATVTGVERASSALERICQWAVAISIPVGLLAFFLRTNLPLVFTSDGRVSDTVTAVLPLLIAFLPLDALGTTLEGGILGASDTRWIALRATASSAASLVALRYASSSFELMDVGSPAGTHALVIVWCCLKILTCMALIADLARFMSPALRSLPIVRTSRRK
jgi:putative MATE family efflux protein